MRIRARHLTILAFLGASGLASCGKAEPPGTTVGQTITVPHGPPISSEDRIVLFAFDDYSIPSTCGLKIQMLQPEKHAGSPIIPRGLAGDPDEDRAQGVSVLREGDRWRLLVPENAGKTTHAAYAESADGAVGGNPNLQREGPQALKWVGPLKGKTA